MSLKVIHGSDVRRVAGKPATLAELRQLLIANIKPALQEDFAVKYQDPDGDMITVDTEEDFKFMLELLQGNLKIHIVSKNAAVKPCSLNNSVVAEAPVVEAQPVPAPVPAPAPVPQVSQPVEPPKPAENLALKKAEEAVAAVKSKLQAMKGPAFDLKVKKVQLSRNLLDIQLARLDLQKVLVTAEQTPERSAEIQGKLANLKKEKKHVKEQLNNVLKAIADHRLAKKKVQEDLSAAEGEVAKLKGPEEPPKQDLESLTLESRCKVFVDMFPHLTLSQIKQIVQARPYCTDEELYDIFLSFRAETLQLGKK